MKKIMSLLLILTLAITMFTGCRNNKTNNEQNENIDDENSNINEINESDFDDFVDEYEKVVPTGPQVYRITGSKVTTLNAHIYETTSESDVISLIYGGLLTMIYDEASHNYKIIGEHAEGLPTISDNRLVYTFKIRENVNWADGTPIDAESYVASWKLLIDPELANYRATSLFEDFKVVNAEEYYKGEAEWDAVGIKALDKYTLEMTIEYPIAPIDFYMVTQAGPLSPVKLDLFEASWNKDKSENSYGTSLETTPSSGPYKLTEWNRDQSRTYVKRDDYVISDYYVITEVKERVIEDRAARMQMFENGDTDEVTLSGADYDKYAEDPRLIFSSSTTTWSMFINMTSEEKPFLTDINFRKAMYYAMARDVITDNIYKTAKPAGYVVSSAKIADATTGLTYRESEAAKAVTSKNNGVDYVLAKEYMQKAFDVHGKMTVELAYFDNSDNLKRVAELLEQEYENTLGEDKIDVVLVAVPWQTSYENMENGIYDMAFGGWSGSRFNPWSGMMVYTSDFSSKIDQFYSKEFDKLWDRTVQGDLIFKPVERLEALAKMEQMLFDSVPFVPFMEPQTPWLFSDRVHLITEGEFIPGVGFATYQSFVDPLE